MAIQFEIVLHVFRRCCCVALEFIDSKESDLMTVVVIAANEEVCAEIQQAIRQHEDHLTIVTRRKLKWYGHVSHSSGLAQTFFQGTVKGGRRQGRQEKKIGRQHQGMERPGVCQVLEGSGEQRQVENTGFEVICGVPTTLAVEGT